MRTRKFSVKPEKLTKQEQIRIAISKLFSKQTGNLFGINTPGLLVPGFIDSNVIDDLFVGFINNYSAVIVKRGSFKKVYPITKKQILAVTLQINSDDPIKLKERDPIKNLKTYDMFFFNAGFVNNRFFPYGGGGMKLYMHQFDNFETTVQNIIKKMNQNSSGKFYEKEIIEGNGFKAAFWKEKDGVQYFPLVYCIRTPIRNPRDITKKCQEILHQRF